MRKKVLISLVILIIAGSLAFLYVATNNQEQNSFSTTGIVESIEVQVESKIPGRLTFVGFREGDFVKKGELVAVVDPSEYEAVRTQAEAALITARKSLGSGYDAVESARARRDAAASDTGRASAELDRANASLAQADIDLGRSKQLFDKGVVPRSELDQATTNRDTLAAGVESAKAALASAKAAAKAADAALKQSEADIATLKARVAEADSGVKLADVRLSDTDIYSPLDALVDYRFLETGETVAAGTPILTLVDTSDLWVRLDVDERYVGRIKDGQPAKVTLEYMPDKVFDGTVFDIGREGSFATERDVTRGRQDIRTFRTRIRVTDPEGILKPGMTVICEIPFTR